MAYGKFCTSASENKNQWSKVTIRDVARRVGVTPMIVSHVFNDIGRIPDTTRAAVRQAMDELCYEPNGNAQRLAGSRDERTIALLPPTLDFDVTWRKISTLQQLSSVAAACLATHWAFTLRGELRVRESTAPPI